MSRFCSVVVALVLFAAACGPSKPPVPPKEYHMEGQVLRLDPQVRTAVIKHGQIGDWMEAMTMEFPIRDPGEFKKLQPGMKITATVYVTDDSYWIGNIKPVQ